MAVSCYGTIMFQASSKTAVFGVVVSSFIGLLSIVNVSRVLYYSSTNGQYMGDIVTNDFIQRALQIETSQPDETFIVDIVSIGSLTKPDYQQAQERTIGKHTAVRNFFPVTELNDTDSKCSEDLTYPQLQAIKKFCKRRNANQSRNHF